MKRGFGKLISAVVGGSAGAVVGGAVVGNKLNQKLKDNQDFTKKIGSYYHLFNQWLSIRQSGKTLADYFVQNEYKTVAIYGMKEFGERLYDELRDTDVIVKYVIDKNADAIYTDVDVVTPEDTLEAVDVIVVTATYYFDEIEEMLMDKVDCPVVSLEDILYEM